MMDGLYNTMVMTPEEEFLTLWELLNKCTKELQEQTKKIACGKGKRSVVINGDDVTIVWSYVCNSDGGFSLVNTAKSFAVLAETIASVYQKTEGSASRNGVFGQDAVAFQVIKTPKKT